MALDYMEKTRSYQEYIDALEEEHRKIQVFHRELPLSLQIIKQAIDNYKKQMTIEPISLRRSDCDEISSDGPVLEEFLPLKRSSSSDEEKSKERSESSTKKPDWLKSVQLWNQEPNLHEKEELPRKLSVGTKKCGGAFQPFHREKETSKVAIPTLVPMAAASSTAETGNGKREEKEGHSNRKARRSWSNELHRRFIDALQQLGGPHVATPKQIKELMNVDGLTNDEVKSHLQKYRLHTRRPNSAIQNNNNSPQPPQYIVVGGIWVPPPEYAAAATAAAARTPQPAEATSVSTNEIYAPIATLPQGLFSKHHQQKQVQQSSMDALHSRGRRNGQKKQCLENENVNSNSPTTSSSSHTTTTSPAF